jgi:hypothetical protein
LPRAQAPSKYDVKAVRLGLLEYSHSLPVYWTMESRAGSWKATPGLASDILRFPMNLKGRKYMTPERIGTSFL